MRTLIVAHGDPPSRELAVSLRAGADLVVGADGGALAARALGIEPDVVIGDLDSLDESVRASFTIVQRPSPDSTDLHKAITYAIEEGATEVVIIGAGGGRADHALANLSVLVLFRGRAHLRIVDELFDIEIVDDQATFDAEPGTVVSLVALGLCRGVSIVGVRWELDAIELPFSPLGVHNVALGGPVTVTVQSGDLLLFRGRWIEDHR